MMRPLFLIPYRNRYVHLQCFLLYMQKHFSHYRIAVIEQSDQGKWNKGLLFNAGYRELTKDYDYIILHDIDFIPNPNVDYSWCELPTLLSTECSQFNYGYCYPTFFGGVVGMSKDHYEKVNGFSNKFQGYGGEDDMMFKSLIYKGLQPQVRLGNRFECFEHPRLKDPIDYNNNLRLLERDRDFNEGLTTSNYKIIGKSDHKECIHLRINTVI